MQTDSLTVELEFLGNNPVALRFLEIVAIQPRGLESEPLAVELGLERTRFRLISQTLTDLDLVRRDYWGDHDGRDVWYWRATDKGARARTLSRREGQAASLQPTHPSRGTANA